MLGANAPAGVGGAAAESPAAAAVAEMPHSKASTQVQAANKRTRNAPATPSPPAIRTRTLFISSNLASVIFVENDLVTLLQAVHSGCEQGITRSFMAGRRTLVTPMSFGFLYFDPIDLQLEGPRLFVRQQKPDASHLAGIQFLIRESASPPGGHKLADR